MGDRPWAHNAAKLSPGPTIVCSSVIPVYGFAPRRIITVSVRGITEGTRMWALIGWDIPGSISAFARQPALSTTAATQCSGISHRLSATLWWATTNPDRTPTSFEFMPLALGSGNEREFFFSLLVTYSVVHPQNGRICICGLTFPLSQKTGSLSATEICLLSHNMAHRSAIRSRALVYRPLCINVKKFSPVPSMLICDWRSIKATEFFPRCLLHPRRSNNTLSADPGTDIAALMPSYLQML